MSELENDNHVFSHGSYSLNSIKVQVSTVSLALSMGYHGFTDVLTQFVLTWTHVPSHGLDINLCKRRTCECLLKFSILDIDYGTFQIITDCANMSAADPAPIQRGFTSSEPATSSVISNKEAPVHLDVADTERHFFGVKFESTAFRPQKQMAAQDRFIASCAQTLDLVVNSSRFCMPTLF